MCYTFRETCTNRHKIGLVNSTSLKKVHFGVSLQTEKGVSAQLFIRVAVQILLFQGQWDKMKSVVELYSTNKQLIPFILTYNVIKEPAFA